MGLAPPTFLSWLWENSLAATLLCGIAAVVTFSAGRKLPPLFHYGFWLLVIVRLIWPATAAAEFSLMNLSPEPPPLARDFAIPPSMTSTPIVTALAPPEGSRPYWPDLLFVTWVFGASASLLIVCAKQRKLTRWAARQPLSNEPRLLQLLAEAQALCRTRAQFERIIVSPQITVPAVFRLRSPVLLLPEALLRDASDDELRLVLAHELIHVKHRDVAINWFCIVVRSLHWFNPAVWFAWRQLCLAREYVCDAAVLSVLSPPERSLYGNLLINLAASAQPPFPRSILVPILQPKPKIHRRILMISQFKRAPLALTAASAAVMIIIACVTFTRAAQEPRQPPAAAQKDTLPVRGSRGNTRDVLAEQLNERQAQVRQMQKEVDELRAQLGIVGREAEAGASTIAEAVQKLEMMELESRTEHRRLQFLSEHLSRLSKNELQSTLPTALPDSQLTALLEQLHATEQRLADLVETHTSEHPEVKRTTRVLAQIEKQLSGRIEGIRAGIQFKAKVEQARLESLQKEAAAVRDQAIQRSIRSRPYQDALRKLRTEEMLLEQLRLRAMQEQLDSALDPAAR